MPERPSLIGRFFRLIFSVINGFRRLVLNVIFFGLLAAIIISYTTDSQTPTIQNGAALVIALDGIVVEELSDVDPLSALTGQNSEQPQEILLSELLYSIQQAAKDDRIAGIVLKPGNLSAGLAKLEDIGHALNDFKESGKPLLFVGGGIEQSEYYLASFADSITINSGGGVAIEGLGMSRLYYKEALDKLQITTHLYRVGKFKSFAESYTRNDMSEPAREAAQEVINDLWHSYVNTINNNRDVDPRVLAPSLDNISSLLEENGNDPAKMALATGLVDKLATDIEMRAGLMQAFGADAKDKNHVNAISYSDYAAIVVNNGNPLIKDKVAIVVAKGTILNGEQPAGTIGGVSTATLLREARLDDNVKAVVLRVDSGGGSAYASEQLRQEVLALQAAGKPVVASMGSVAASGGYWISASADRIFAQPNTITGSIGIISMFQTFEKAAEYIGVHQDGVSTSDIREISFIEPINEKVGPIVQRLMDKGYHDFISLVASSRDMELKQVDAIAQGRIWSGTAALEHGLVDELGSLDEAVAAAADLARLVKYDTKVISHELTPEQILVRELMNSVSAYLPDASTETKLLWQLKAMLKPIEAQLQLDDPNNLYYLCMECTNVH